ncbi:hypothetical protein AO1008_09664 [Aspergillus oryzae 100-8]|uniref:Alpha-ketoglutarate-dependent sulfonate dioxygenase n=2 Tax=Aspergillus oryzae TaxID=5062 RepID=A0A1S9D8T8_ASPOZ|nr:hypothetical protein Ao3042_05232 [Aspergillus oryzae 3.042]KDE83183.1 hypothetical protein AO1008_09664 [Aspergillus oryzae 100-8]OOO05501.1 protein of unknown function DUF1399 [Aspergillus oryzae]|eukprot:EIT78554.1 hypothetical protein Ao3042_05232 [Aspergillus oryzae 3.042]
MKSSPFEKITEDVSEAEPPAYGQVDQPPLVLPPLDLFQTAGPPVCSTVTQDQCIAHLKFLAALADLRDNITNINPLFQINDPDPAIFGDSTNEAFARVKEKRWAVYTARAVDRYTTWWQECIQSPDRAPKLHDLEDDSYDSITEHHKPYNWSPKTMPPLDILMVWHAHMLNPRVFLEDCIRGGAMGFWTAGFPWELVNSCIDDQSLEYHAGQAAVAHFQQKTGLPWDNLKCSSKKPLSCPSCKHELSVPWTEAQISAPVDEAFENCRGFADKNFQKKCPVCKFEITHETLKTEKFRKDVRAFWASDVPMPGTFYDVRGVPKAATISSRKKRQSLFPNRLIKAIGTIFLSQTDPTDDDWKSMAALRDKLQSRIKSRDVMRRVNPDSGISSLFPEEKVAFRRMMARYWDNHTPFALDLVGAVIRQGTFVQKMDNIDWLHSPTVKATMDRLIKKYEVFFQIMAQNPRNMAVPTLDVDLAWHTHQLSPSRYFDYSVFTTRQHTRVPKFIDHDDKVEETKLSDGFEWTSKMYKKLTKGDIYSECTCWYCEAIRAPDLSDGIFVSSSTSRAREAAANLHNRPDISSDPEKNPHISAHSAVPAETKKTRAGFDPRYVKHLKLQSNYQKARRRAEKRDRKQGNKEQDRSSDATLYAMAYGYPVYVPYYAPYVADPCVHSNAYPSNPGCMSFVSGAHGNCAAGTCGGAVAAGGCGGMGGGCAGGCAGGGGGGAAGGCGSGGGAGCGGSSSGGGGGGGCGGGGGGGGCGGGGGGC